MSEQPSVTAPPRIVRDGYPPGVTCWVDVELRDPIATSGFYAGLFGWEFEDRMPPDVPGVYLVAHIDGLDVAALGSQPTGSQFPPAWNTYVWVGSADETAAKVARAGGAILVEPLDVADAGRMAVVADPQGAAFRLWQAAGHRGAQLVNEERTWGFSGLTTTDVGAAKAFYDAVFGWKADLTDDWTFFRVPGYGDVLARSDPDLRARLEAADATDGFEDATAFLMSMAGQPAGTAPRWEVTFNVADTDAAVARVTELGGRALVEPFDAPPVRMAVLSDPEGAVFTVSCYDPQSG